MEQMATAPVRVWDPWVRLFHWSLVVLIALSWWTYDSGRMEWHARSGYAILALLLFRLLWGLLGSETARFAGFLASPLAAARHIAHITRREPDTQVGHNAAGGWMVLGLLALLLFQAGTGLFANDDISFKGPLAERVSKEASDWLTGLHHRNFNLILLAVGLHVLAVISYAVLKRHDLVRPMVTGWKRLPLGSAAPRLGSPVLAVLLLAVAAGLVFGLSRLG
jgi:cytochrome b